MNEQGPSEFEMLTEPIRENLLAEFLAFLGHNKKWWLLPIVLLLLLFGVMMFVTTTAAAPFIYTLF